MSTVTVDSAVAAFEATLKPTMHPEVLAKRRAEFLAALPRPAVAPVAQIAHTPAPPSPTTLAVGQALAAERSRTQALQAIGARHGVSAQMVTAAVMAGTDPTTFEAEALASAIAGQAPSAAKREPPALPPARREATTTEDLVAQIAGFAEEDRLAEIATHQTQEDTNHQ